MIPVVNFVPDFQIPQEASFWMPNEDEIPDDEGLGCFRDVWMILNEPPDYARRIVDTETTLIDLADRAAHSSEEFEVIARIIETGEIDELSSLPARTRFSAQEVEMLDWIESIEPPLGNLELGVSGLAHALSAIGAVPVASCRGHIKGWSDRPVVYAAVDEPRAYWLQPLVQNTGCGFHIGLNREEFLALEGPSIRHMNRLAQTILALFSEGGNVFERWIDADAINSRYE
ncbi:hypothetical protein [Streptomyces sp. NPDC085659]|uniref:hypothetical protein n=1 Tax=Streptomyces sp. NPDC085659 TaxID=3155177 RepID=UPI00344E6F77